MKEAKTKIKTKIGKADDTENLVKTSTESPVATESPVKRGKMKINKRGQADTGRRSRRRRFRK